MTNKLIYLPEPNEIHENAKSDLVKAGYELTHDANRVDIVGIFIKTNTVIDKAYLEGRKNLKFVIRAGVGLDNIDSSECQNRNIQIFSSPFSNSNSVAEYVIFLALLMSRKFIAQHDELARGSWRNQNFIGSEIKGKIVGLVGTGNIGKIVSGFFKGLGANKILSYDPFIDKEALALLGIEKCELADIFSNSHIISLHLPLNNDTKNLIGKKLLELMKPGSCLINTARGGVLDEDALITFLESNPNVNFALDVFENEPNINKKLLHFKNVQTTPHIAAYTIEAQEHMSTQAVDNFLAKFKES